MRQTLFQDVTFTKEKMFLVMTGTNYKLEINKKKKRNVISFRGEVRPELS